MKFEHTVLDHGLQVVAEVNPQAYSASFGIFVNAGSRDETEANSGVSHFLEHMAFKGNCKPDCRGRQSAVGRDGLPQQRADRRGTDDLPCDCPSRISNAHH